MTIDSSWIASFKEEVPAAFTKTIPFRPKAAFCDGQIRLMRGHAQDFMTWDMYLWQQFTGHVRKFYDKHHVSTVILAFDDYAHVPEAKCMTQLKRRRRNLRMPMLRPAAAPAASPATTQQLWLQWATPGSGGRLAGSAASRFTAAARCAALHPFRVPSATRRMSSGTSSWTSRI